MRAADTIYNQINQVVTQDWGPVTVSPGWPPTELQLWPELIIMMTRLPSILLLLLSALVKNSFQFAQTSPETTNVEDVVDFLTDDLIIKRFYVVLTLQVKYCWPFLQNIFLHHKNHEKVAEYRSLILSNKCSPLASPTFCSFSSWAWAGWLPTRCGDFSIPQLRLTWMLLSSLTSSWMTRQASQGPLSMLDM